MSLSVLIPTFDTRDLVLAAVAAVLREAGHGAEVIVIDDGSSDGTSAALREAAPTAVVVRHETPRGFSAAVNHGLGVARGELILILNSDTELRPGALTALRAAFAQNPVLGVAGGRLFFPDGRAQWSGGREPGLSWLFALASGAGPILGRLRDPRNAAAGHHDRIDWVSGAALAARREVFSRCGPLDERYAFYCQDLDLCHCARQRGFSVAVVPGFEVIHHHGATIARDGGTVGQRLELLLPDLVRYFDKYRGPDAARRARAVMRLGLALRRACAAVFRGSPERRSALRAAHRSLDRAAAGDSKSAC